MVKTIVAVICLILLLGTSDTSYAQSERFEPGILYLRNGDSLVGDIKISKTVNYLQYKKQDSKKKSKKKYNFKTVKRITINGLITYNYIYKIVQDGGATPKLLREEVISEDLSLYSEVNSKINVTLETVVSSTGGYGNAIFTDKEWLPTWYVGNANSSFVESLPSSREEVMKRFNNCQAVILEYRLKSDTDFYMIEFIKFYNANCAVE